MFTALLAVHLLVAPVVARERLGHPVYRQREAAQRYLHGWGRVVLPLLLSGARHSSQEVRRRCEALTAPYAEELADAQSRHIRPTNWPRRPWLDLYDGQTTYYLRKAQELGAKGAAPDWPVYREATRIWVVSQLIQRRPVAEIVRELDQMATAERGWIITNGGNCSPPVKLPKGYK